MHDNLYQSYILDALKIIKIAFKLSIRVGLTIDNQIGLKMGIIMLQIGFKVNIEIGFKIGNRKLL